MNKLLIIEDEKQLALSLESHFSKLGLNVEIALDGKEGIEKFNNFSPQLVLLDINLPKVSGWEVCEYIKKDSNCGVIMMTARDSELDEIHGLEIGADDYITKPFSLNILTARIKKYLKIKNLDVYLNNKMEYSFKDEILRIEDLRVNLSNREKNLLEFFLKNKNIPLSRGRILVEIWGMDNEFDERASDTLVKRLRKKMGDYGDLIGTVRGVGYIFEEN